MITQGERIEAPALRVIDGASGDGALQLGLSRASTAVERRLIAAWARARSPSPAITAIDDPRLAGRLEDDAVEVFPLSVVWLPRERGGSRRLLARDLLALTHPLRPWPLAQRLIARRAPDRARVIAGEPATVAELRARHVQESGEPLAPDAFAAFVRRQAVVAADRAERAVIGDRYKVPRLLADQITASSRFRAEVHGLAERLGRGFDDVLADAERCVRELATVQSPIANEIFRLVLRPMHARAWTVRADTAPLARLRELNRRSALVFLPAHRSYVDPLVLGDVLQKHDFPPNHILGGDNMSFFPIGPLGRRAGIIFIRRNFGDDRIYKLAVREFLGHVVSKRFNLEWYIEGGRSRTGKLRPPRYGLLHYLVQAIEAGRAEDVQLVPVSIAYEHMQEAGAIAAEQAGRSKPREGFLWFLRYIRAQRRNVGIAHVTFGEPLSLRASLAAAGDGSARLEKVAFAISVGINRVTPVTASGLVTFALLGAHGRALTLTEVCAVTEPLLEYCTSRRVPGPIDELRDPERVGAALDALVAAGMAECYAGGTEPIWRIAAGGHRVAAIFRNGSIHWFVMRSIVELVLLGLGDRRLDAEARAAGLEDALALRDLLKFEFFFSPKRQFAAELEEELATITGDAAPEQESARALLRAAPTLLADRVLRSFIEAQAVVAELLAERDCRRVWDERRFLAEALATGRQRLLQGRLVSEDAVSRDLFGSAIRLAGNRGLLEGRDAGLIERRRAFRNEVIGVSGRLAAIAALERGKLDGVLA